MSTEIEWSSPDQEAQASQPGDNRPARRRWPWILAALLILVFVIIAILYRTNRPVDEKLLRSIQLTLDAEQRAVAGGNGAIFFAIQADDPAWQASQIGLAHDLTQAENLDVIHAEEHGDQIWAVLRYTLAGKTVQRQAFFEWNDGRLLHIESDPDFWGRTVTQSYPWGTLQLYRVDQAWAETIGNFVTSKTEALCSHGCIEGRQPFTLTMSADYGATAVPGKIRMPSPRLVGLDGGSNPSPLYWKRLAHELDAYLRPAEIRFAAPDEFTPRLQSMAVDFTLLHPDINVEVFPFSRLPTESTQMLSLVDGAYLRPTPSLIASDHVYDLTSLTESDPEATLDDFYTTMLTASSWRGRLWALPLSAEMPLIYYDEPSFVVATLSPEGYLAHTWLRTIRQSADPLAALRTDTKGWGFIDSSPASLYAHAFAQRCAAGDEPFCADALREEDLASTLKWYYALVVQEGNMPDLTSMDEDERAFNVLNLLSFPRDVPMWVDLPAFHEHTNQLGGVGVLRLQAATGNGTQVGPSPIHVNSGVISRASENPVAVWTWLNYLSQQRPAGSVRSIPARPSVAEEIRYWETLPPDLQEPMSSAFENARAVSIAEEPFFGWEALAELVNQPVDTAEIAKIAEGIAARMTKTRWFDYD